MKKTLIVLSLLIILSTGLVACDGGGAPPAGGGGTSPAGGGGTSPAASPSPKRS